MCITEDSTGTKTQNQKLSHRLHSVVVYNSNDSGNYLFFNAYFYRTLDLFKTDFERIYSSVKRKNYCLKFYLGSENLAMGVKTCLKLFFLVSCKNDCATSF